MNVCAIEDGLIPAALSSTACGTKKAERKAKNTFWMGIISF